MSKRAVGVGWSQGYTVRTHFSLREILLPGSPMLKHVEPHLLTASSHLLCCIFSLQ